MPLIGDIDTARADMRDEFHDVGLAQEARGALPSGASPAERFIGSSTYRAARTGEFDHGSVRVADAGELGALLANAGDLDAFRRVSTRTLATLPNLHDLLSRLTIIPVEAGTDVRPIAEGLRAIDGLPGQAVGDALPGLNWTLTDVSDLRLKPWGVAIPLDDPVIESPPVMAGLMTRLLDDVLLQALEADILVGDGSESGVGYHLAGIATNDDIHDIAASAFVAPSAALAEAVGRVGAGGFTRRLAAAATPGTIAATFALEAAGGAALAEAVPLIEAFVPTLGLPDGQMVIGDFASAYLFTEGLTVGLRDRPLDGQWLVRAGTNLALWVPHPSAFARVTELPATDDLASS